LALGDAAPTLALVGDSICNNGPWDGRDHMGWCNLLDTSDTSYISGVWPSGRRVVDVGVGGLQVFQFHQCLTPTDGTHNCWPPVKAQKPKYMLWNLGEDDQDCMYEDEYATCKDTKECVQKEFIPEMSAMLGEDTGIKHILVTPAPLMESSADARKPGWSAYEELIAANQQLKKDMSSVVAVLPLWKVLDCYYGKVSPDVLDDLKEVNTDGTKDNRHNTACGAAVHTHALLDLLNRAQIDDLEADLDRMVAHVNEVCQRQDLAALKQCAATATGTTLV